MQIYAPVEDNPNAFHRSIYIFISPDGSKVPGTAGAIKALRCQLPRHNAFYAYDPPKKEERYPPTLPQDKVALSLSKDPWHVLAYERNTWLEMQSSRGAEHEDLAAHQGPLPCAPLFPETELVVEPEPEDTGNDLKDEKMKALLTQYKHRSAEEGEYTEEELPGDMVDTLEGSVTEEQRHFAAFAARMAIEPAQVLRYCFVDGATPLCPSPVGVPGPADVPCCARCGGRRRFEFQIMPQLLNHLDIDASNPEAPDWGTIAVYSCAMSCGEGAWDGTAAEGFGVDPYVEEWVWVQSPL